MRSIALHTALAGKLYAPNGKKKAQKDQLVLDPTGLGDTNGTGNRSETKDHTYKRQRKQIDTTLWYCCTEEPF